MTRTRAIIETGVEVLALPKADTPLLEMICEMYTIAQWLDVEEEPNGSDGEGD